MTWKYTNYVPGHHTHKYEQRTYKKIQNKKKLYEIVPSKLKNLIKIDKYRSENILLIN